MPRKKRGTKLRTFRLDDFTYEQLALLAVRCRLRSRATAIAVAVCYIMDQLKRRSHGCMGQFLDQELKSLEEELRKFRDAGGWV